MVYTITETALLYSVIYEAAAAALTGPGSAISRCDTPVENQQIIQTPQ